MPRLVLLEEFHLTVRAPRGLRELQYRAIRRRLHDPRILAQLRLAVRRVIQLEPALRGVRVRLSW